LKHYQKERCHKIKIKKWKASNLDALIFLTLIKNKISGESMKEMLSYLMRDKNELSLYGKALFGLALNDWVKHVTMSAEDKKIYKDMRDLVIQNIEQFLVIDKENQTAYLDMRNNNYWWYWYGSNIETQAAYLELLVATQPNAVKTRGLVKYLLNNRKHATYWNSTRDTALVVAAFANYISATKEDKADMEIDIFYDNKLLKTVKIDSKNLFSYDNKLVLKGDEITSGKHTIKLVRRGQGTLYYNAYLSYFTLEDFITKAGMEIKVNRHYYKLERIKDATAKVQGAHGEALKQAVEKYKRIPLKKGDMLVSGDLVEVELEIDSKNDYEYLLFKDMKPAGLETIDVRSGYIWEGLNAYREFRDSSVCFFVRQLSRGKHSVRYRMRAEIPGRFSALPTQGYAMYAPELRTNSDENKITVIDKE
jgi:uncharacterized protein YfaS (alpha-2-macroglobulin family)